MIVGMRFVSTAAGAAAVILGGWIAVMRFIPEIGGVKRDDLNKWLAIDTAEVATLAGLSVTAAWRPSYSHVWALAGTDRVVGDGALDVSIAKTGPDRDRAIGMAALIEVPSALALGSWTLHRVIKRRRAARDA